MSIQALRGMKDHWPLQADLYRLIENKAQKIFHQFNYQEISTPLIESIEVFQKTLGTDILDKELYQFEDKGGSTVALRPEGTAGVARALINEKTTSLPLRLFYSGPMFRYERPQKGRLRQFHQIGCEFFGEASAYAELEMIQMAVSFLKELKILPQTKLIINSIGDQESRRRYKDQLLKYLEPYKKDLSKESQVRLVKNPLRILDSKSKQDQKILKTAPRPLDSLSLSSRSFYEEVLNLLTQNNISFQQDDFLVRGLDYYSHTVFEWISSEVGAQNALLAGGRYDALIQTMGGKPCSAIGWACGVERLSLICSLLTPSQTLVSILTANSSLEKEKIIIAQKLREQNIAVSLSYTFDQPLKKQLKKSNQLGCSHVVILGLNEWKKGQLILKNMKTGTQEIHSKNLEMIIPLLKKKPSESK